MRLATFNANSVRSRLPIILDWLATHQPDVLCLQETKVQDADFPTEGFTGAGYQVVFRGEKSYNGVAIVSREKPDEIRFGLDDGKSPDETRLVAARFGSLQIVNTYVPQGRSLDHPMFAYKLEWFRRLKSFFDRHYQPNQPIAWLGDLNIAPAPEDVHNAADQEDHVCYHRDVRAAFADTVSWGFTDVFRRHHPEPGHYTFFDYRTVNAVKRKMGWRVDHILVTKPLVRTSCDCSIDLAPRLLPSPSDHTFLFADFSPASGKPA